MGGSLLGPYAPLAVNRPFVALWVAQAVSLVGDRVHQVALAVMVLGLTGDPALVGLVFVAATLPRLLVGPIAGVYVDRYDRRIVMVATDLARAGLVLLVPVAAAASPLLTLPLTFVITSLGLAFRPAKLAAIATIAPDHLGEANAAVQVADALADLAGYPIAAVVTVVLAPVLWVAFVLDSLSYAGSAVLLRRLPPCPVAADDARTPFVAGLLEGLRWLRLDRALLEHTLLYAVAMQGMLAAGTSLLVVYAHDALHDGFPYEAAYAGLLLAGGVGNLVGGVVAGGVVGRLATGRLVLVMYVVHAGAIGALALTASATTAFLLMFVAGMANLVWLVAFQTFTLTRVPHALTGRVVAAITALAAASMIAYIALFSTLATVLPASAVLGIAGAYTLLATMAAAGRRAIRRPDVFPVPA